MKIFRFHRLMSKLKSPSLTRAERNTLRSEFLMKTGLGDAPPSYFFNMLPRYAVVTAYSFLIAVVFVSPIAFSAEKSEPGDLLYPVKVIVNEPVKKVLKVVIPYKQERILDEDDTGEKVDQDKKSRKNNSSRNDDQDDKDNKGDSDDQDGRGRNANNKDVADQAASSTKNAPSQTGDDMSTVTPGTTTVPLVPAVTKLATSSSASSPIPTPAPSEGSGSSTKNATERTNGATPGSATGTEAEVSTEDAGASGDDFRNVLYKASSTLKDTIQKLSVPL